jgi:hypothetical protein
MVGIVGIILVAGPSKPFLRRRVEDVLRHRRRQLFSLEIGVDLLRGSHGHANGCERRVCAIRSRDNTVSANVEVGELPHLRVVVGNGLVDLGPGDNYQLWF